MTPLVFHVPGEPQPWRRSRTSGKRHFKDVHTQENQDAWAWEARVAMGPRPIFEGPVQMTVVCVFQTPKRPRTQHRWRFPMKRPDADNLSKNMDALNGVVWRDDAQVVRLQIEKVWATGNMVPGVLIQIEDMP